VTPDEYTEKWMRQNLMRNVRLDVTMGNYALLAALGKAATSYLEVGTYEGGSLAAVLQRGSSVRYAVCVDDWRKRIKEGKPAGHAHVDRMLAQLGHENTPVRFLEGPSTKMIPTLHETFDLTLVDADHSEEACATDMSLVWPITTGAMAVHDVWLKAGVRSAIWKFVKSLGANVSASMCGGDHGTLVLFR